MVEVDATHDPEFVIVQVKFVVVPCTNPLTVEFSSLGKSATPGPGLVHVPVSTIATGFPANVVVTEQTF